MIFESEPFFESEPWQVLDTATAPSGERLVLRRRGAEFSIRCDGWDLMGSRAQHSEQELARQGCADLSGGKRGQARVLIGGLGMGYTLRAALDVLPAAARVTVAEIFPAVVAWNRGPLAPLAGRPLDDPRVAVASRDVAALLAPGAWEAILLDVDNGPDAAMLAPNAALYGAPGLARLAGALATGGGSRSGRPTARPASRRRWRRRAGAGAVRRFPRGGFPPTPVMRSISQCRRSKAFVKSVPVK